MLYVIQCEIDSKLIGYVVISVRYKKNFIGGKNC
jgi:hypothetical protein